MLENSGNGRFEMPDEWIPENDIECVDEIDNIICMIAGLRNMFFEVTDALPCAKKDGIIWEGYKMIISRESGRVIKRLETVSENLLMNVQRRGRIRRAVRMKRERRTGVPCQ
ncbi:MAG: hypothetical protein IKM02_01375 [Clostridia bacterium]|nr:hypothetical protein [Clostridia bacterium]